MEVKSGKALPRRVSSMQCVRSRLSFFNTLIAVCTLYLYHFKAVLYGNTLFTPRVFHSRLTRVQIECPDCVCTLDFFQSQCHAAHIREDF